MKIFLIMMALAGLVVGPVAAADPNNLPQTTPGEGAPAIAQVQGRVNAVDLSQRTLKIEDQTQKIWQVQIDSKTRIQDLQNKDLALDHLHTGDKVNIYYNTADFTARQIDLIPTLTEEAIGAK